MIKKIFFTIICFISNFWIFLAWAQNTIPVIECEWIPGCNGDWWKYENSIIWIWNIVSEWIKYVSLLAVISLILSWFLYLFSWWEDEKTKKAKNWIIYSLIWVVLSVSAWWIINMINNIEIS